MIKTIIILVKADNNIEELNDKIDEQVRDMESMGYEIIDVKLSSVCAANEDLVYTALIQAARDE